MYCVALQRIVWCLVLEHLTYHLAVVVPNVAPTALKEEELLDEFAGYIFPVLSAPNAWFF
jgi:hypothetical protein